MSASGRQIRVISLRSMDICWRAVKLRTALEEKYRFTKNVAAPSSKMVTNLVSRTLSVMMALRYALPPESFLMLMAHQVLVICKEDFVSNQKRRDGFPPPGKEELKRRQRRHRDDGA